MIHALAVIAQEMKKAVQGNRVFGAARIAGPQTSIVNRLNIPASAMAATRAQIESRIPMPQAICPAPVRYAQPIRKGSHAGTRATVSFVYMRWESPIGMRETAKRIRAK